MSWDGPDRERGPYVVDKPYCNYRPVQHDVCWPLVSEYLRERGLSETVARANGWYPSREAGDDILRVVIPCTSANSSNLYWQARCVDDSLLGPQGLRYQSPHGVQRGDAIVMVNPLKEVSGTCLVEGPFDALAAAEVGYLGIAWMGMRPGQGPIDLAKVMIYPGKPIYVVADSGISALGAAVDIWRNFPGAFLVEPYPYKDLGEMPRKERRALLDK